MSRSSRYPEEIRQRAVGMVFEWRKEHGDPRGGCAQVARQLGINKETLRNWGVSRTRKEAVCRSGL